MRITLYLTAFMILLSAHGQPDPKISELQKKMLSLPRCEFLVKHARVDGPYPPESLDIKNLKFAALINRNGERFSICFRNDSDSIYSDDYYWDGAYCYIFKRDVRQLHIAKRGERPIVPPMYFTDASTDMGITLFRYHCDRFKAYQDKKISIESTEHAPFVNYTISDTDGQKLECSFLNLREGYVVGSMKYSRPEKGTVFEFKNHFSSNPTTFSEIGALYLGCSRATLADKLLIDVFSIKILSWESAETGESFIPNIQGEYRVIDFRGGEMMAYKTKGVPPTLSRLKEAMANSNWSGDL